MRNPGRRRGIGEVDRRAGSGGRVASGVRTPASASQEAQKGTFLELGESLAPRAAEDDWANHGFFNGLVRYPKT